MNGAKSQWLIAGMAAIIGALATLLVVEVLNHGGSQTAYGQTGTPAGEANYVLGMLGAVDPSQHATPLVLVDTHNQTLLIYDYMTDRHTMFLRVARHYASDVALQDSSFWAGDNYSGPSVSQVKGMLRH